MLGRGLVVTFTSLMLQFHPRNFHTPGRLSVTPCCSLELFEIACILEPAIEDIDTARASVAQNIHKDRSLPMALSKLRSKIDLLELALFIEQDFVRLLSGYSSTTHPSMRVSLEIERSNYLMTFKRVDSRNLLQTRSHLHGMIKDTWYTRVKMSGLGGMMLLKEPLCHTNGLQLKERGKKDWGLVYISSDV